ncbi:MAG: hypothetical protein J7K48_03210 [Thermococcus sp.]|nr:hypothetical protein [Thermococcus sp.]
MSSVKGMQIHARKGDELLEKLLSQDPAYGGRQAAIYGAVGSGKTTLLLWLAQVLQARGEWIIWRGRDTDGWHMLPNWKQRVKLLVHEKDEVHVYKVPYGGTTATEITKSLNIEKYSTPEDLLTKLEQDKINIVYEPTFYQITQELATYILARTNIRIPSWQMKEAKGIYFWFELFEKLITRKDRRWITIIVDEADDLIPANPQGLQWRLQEWVKNSVKDFRKNLITLILAVHNAEDCDHRVIRKLPIRIYLQGARVDKDSLMTDKTITQRLNPGEAKIEWRGFGYGGFKFPPLERRDYAIIVEKKWTGELPKFEEDKRTAGSIIQELREIAEEEGIEEALERAWELVQEGVITKRYYYQIRKALREES